MASNTTKTNRGGKRITGAPVLQPTQGKASAPTIKRKNIQYGSMSDKDAQDLRDIQDDTYNGSVTAAVKQYISGGNPLSNSAASNVDGQGHSMAQVMNYLLEQGEDLSATDVNTINKKYGLKISPRWFASMQYSDTYMQQGAHDLGGDYNLTRLAHDDVLKNEFGIGNYTRMSTAQLKQKLVGATFSNKAYLSTSYDIKKNPFSTQSGSGVGGGREVVYNIKAPKETKVLMGNKAQSEIIIAKGQRFRITDVRDTGRIATPRGGASKRQIVIDIEIY